MLVDVRDFAQAEVPYGENGPPKDYSSYADQTFGFQRAIDLVAESGRGVVLVPSNNEQKMYVIKGTLTLKEGVTLTGGGVSVPLGRKSSTGWNGAIVHIPANDKITSLFQLAAPTPGLYTSGVMVENLSFYNPDDHTSPYCFQFKLPENVTVRNCEVDGFQTGLYLYYGISSRFENIRFGGQKKCAVQLGDAILDAQVKGAKETTTITFRECYFSNCSDTCVKIEGSDDDDYTTTHSGIRFYDCIFESSCCAMEATSGGFISLFGCYTENIPCYKPIKDPKDPKRERVIPIPCFNHICEVKEEAQEKVEEAQEKAEEAQQEAAREKARKSPIFKVGRPQKNTTKYHLQFNLFGSTILGPPTGSNIRDPSTGSTMETPKYIPIGTAAGVGVEIGEKAEVTLFSCRWTNVYAPVVALQKTKLLTSPYDPAALYLTASGNSCIGTSVTYLPKDWWSI